MDETQINEAARVLMHLIETGRKCTWKDPEHMRESWPYLYGSTPKNSKLQEFEAADIIDRLAGGSGVKDGFVSEWWSDDFGMQLTRVRTAEGIIRKAEYFGKKAGVTIQTKTKTTKTTTKK